MPLSAISMRRGLLIEDNEDACDMMAALLEMLSCDVTAEATGAEGIELAQRE